MNIVDRIIEKLLPPLIVFFTIFATVVVLFLFYGLITGGFCG